ncbi:MAG: PAS domain-containing protein [Thiovulaceae bacterium]|nr:PAS domain-containing protein [Sulfurimonadaceae bacterium]MCW9026920.1 PAS domain-containing protein [Sulfurimonadaceae bacterium]
MNKITPINEEFIHNGKAIISQTDISGKIIYANTAFYEASGYTSEQVIGSTYDIIRHPDMPKIIFEKLWNSIRDGQSWTGLIKNLRSDGKYYWDDLSVLPIKDNNGEIVSYISVARQASKKNIQENETLYAKMLTSEI